MDQKKLDNLPKSDDPYWEKSEVKLNEMKPGRFCTHEFIQKTAREVSCKNNCGLSYILGKNDKLVEGHIYNGKYRLI